MYTPGLQMLASRIPFIALLIPCFGCAEDAKLSIEINGGQPVEVDTRCDNGGCDEPVHVEALLSIKGDDHPNATVEIFQYRVVYDLSGVEDVPYHAATTNLDVSVTAPATLTAVAASERQRAWVLSEVGYDRVEGTATLELAGYDQDDEVVLAEAEFEILFGDSDGTTSGDAGSDTDGGTP